MTLRYEALADTESPLMCLTTHLLRPALLQVFLKAVDCDVAYLTSSFALACPPSAAIRTHYIIVFELLFASCLGRTVYILKVEWVFTRSSAPQTRLCSLCKEVDGSVEQSAAAETWQTQHNTRP